MENNQILLNGQPDQSLPTQADACPITTLLGKRITQMTDEELDLHIAKMRSARESPQVFRTLLSGKARKVKSTKITKKPDLSLLGL